MLICVPTPLTANREPDLGPLIDSARALADVLQAGQLVVLESTTYPGTTRERLVPILEESGLAAGRDFHLAFSPERVDPGRTDHNLRNTPKVIGGLTPTCAQRAQDIYGIVCEHLVPVSTPEAAELTKLLENIFRSVNIALVNELAMLTDRMGIDIWEVLDAASTKPYGFMRFDPGPGMGGHCLPVDPFYLSWRARGRRGQLPRPPRTDAPALDLSSVPLDEALADADLTLIVTAHPGIDHDRIASHARLLLDLRGVTRGTHVENLPRRGARNRPPRTAAAATGADAWNGPADARRRFPGSVRD